MNTDRWDYKDFDPMASFRVVDSNAAGWTLFWATLIALLVTDFGRIFA